MKEKKIIIPIAIVMGIILVLTIAMGFYFGGTYHAEISDEVMESDDAMRVLDRREYIAFEPRGGYDDAFIFYQGAKVDEKAYAPMMREIAKSGVLCFIIKMPFNFAIFNVDAAEDIIEEFDDEKLDWYVGGHSLGGAMAASFAEDNPFDVKGLILFSAYSTKDVSFMEVLSIYGDQDEVLDMDKYEDCKENLPQDFKEVVIEGGNHANFGYYGEQRGDGDALIAREEQIEIAVQSVVSFIK